MEGEQIIAGVFEYLFSPLYQLAVVLSTLYFLYGVFMFVWELRNPDQGDAQKRNEGRQHMMWGLLGLFIILSVGGIIKFFNETLGGMFQY